MVALIFNTRAQMKPSKTATIYRANTSYNSNFPKSSYQTNTSVRHQNGYFKSNGTYVQPHYKTNINKTNWDNFSTKGNYNYYKGNTGTRARDYSIDAYNYGKGKVIQTGPKGGQYYINSSGKKIYVPKRWGEKEVEVIVFLSHLYFFEAPTIGIELSWIPQFLEVDVFFQSCRHKKDLFCFFRDVMDVLL